MTIGAMPRNPAMIHELVGGPLVVPLTPLDGDAFADTLRAVAGDPRDTVERFNENGFFADAGAVAISGQAVAAPAAAQAAETQSQSPAIPSLSAADLLAQTDLCREPVIGTATEGERTKPSALNAASFAAPLLIAAPSARVVAPSFAPPLRTSPQAAIDQPESPARIGKARQPQSEAARSPIGVKFDVKEGAAAITVAAHGLTDREAAALRTDIVALLRRHGLVLDDLRLNGRSTAHGHDRSGG